MTRNINSTGSKEAMPENYSRNLDEIDRTILQILRTDSRTTATAIAKVTKLSKTAVKYRIDKLRERGVIKGFFALVDSAAYGKSLSVVFDLTVEPRRIEEVADQIGNLSEVVRTYELTNSPELHVHALFTDQSEMERFLKTKLYPVLGITGIKTGIIIKRYKIDVTLTV